MDTKKAKVRELAEKDDRYVWHALSRYTPTVGGGAASVPRMIVAEGQGAWFPDTDDNRYLDGMSGLWCVNVGYGREELARAACEQLASVSCMLRRTATAARTVRTGPPATWSARGRSSGLSTGSCPRRSRASSWSR